MFYRYGQVQHLNSREKTSLLGRLIEKYRIFPLKKLIKTQSIKLSKKLIRIILKDDGAPGRRSIKLVNLLPYSR